MQNEILWKTNLSNSNKNFRNEFSLEKIAKFQMISEKNGIDPPRALRVSGAKCATFCHSQES
jgi:hypothetical protein